MPLDCPFRTVQFQTERALRVWDWTENNFDEYPLHFHSHPQTRHYIGTHSSSLFFVLNRSFDEYAGIVEWDFSNGQSSLDSFTRGFVPQTLFFLLVWLFRAPACVVYKWNYDHNRVSFCTDIIALAGARAWLLYLICRDSSQTRAPARHPPVAHFFCY